METNKAPKPELTERASEIIGLYQKALNVVDKEEKEKALNEFGLSLVKLLVPKFEPKFEIEEKSAVDTMINGLGAATLYFGSGSAGDRVFFRRWNMDTDDNSRDGKVGWMLYPRPDGKISYQPEQYKRWIDNFGSEYVDLRQPLG
jgi:hypothetical protein